MECCDLSRLNTSEKISIDDALLDFKRTGKYRSAKDIETQKTIDEFNIYIDDFVSFNEEEKRGTMRKIENTMFRWNDPYVFSFDTSSENKTLIEQQVEGSIYSIKKQIDGTYDIYKDGKIITAGDTLFFGKIKDFNFSEKVMSALSKFSKNNTIDNSILLSTEVLNDTLSRKGIELDTKEFFSSVSNIVQNVKDYGDVLNSESVQVQEGTQIEAKETDRRVFLQNALIRPLLNKYLNISFPFNTVEDTFKALIQKAKETDRLKEFLTDAHILLQTDADEKNLPMVAFLKIPLIVNKTMNMHDKSNKTADIFINNYISKDKSFHKIHSLVYKTSTDNTTRQKYDQLMSNEYGQTLLQQFRGYSNSEISDDRLYQEAVASIIRELKLNKYENLSFYMGESSVVKGFVSSVEKIIIEANKKTKSLDALEKITFKGINSNILNSSVERAKETIEKVKTFSVDTPLSSIMENIKIEEEEYKPSPVVSKVEKIAERLSKSLGVEYEFVSVSQAKTMTNEPNAIAFFKENKVYFVKERINESSAFHEFCHPFIRTLIKKNPKLAQNLYEDLTNTYNGKLILQEVLTNYPEISKNPERIMEECLVKAMQKSNDNQSIVRRIIASIKQIIRSIFPKKLSLDSLSENTSLEELVDLLNSGESIAIDTFNPTEVASFDKMIFSEQNLSLIESNIKKKFFAPDNQTKRLNNDAVDIYLEDLSIFTKRVLKRLEENDYKYLKAILKDDKYNDLFLQLLGDIQKATTKLGKDKAVVSLDDLINQKTRGLVKSLVRMASISEALLQYAEALESASSMNEQVKNLYLYNNIVNELNTKIQEAKRVFPKSFSSFFSNKDGENIFAKIEQDLQKATERMNRKFFELAESIVLAQSEGLSESINTQFEEEIAKYNVNSNGRKLAEIEYYGMPLTEYNRLHDLWKEYIDKKTEPRRKKQIVESKEFKTLAGRIQHSLKIEPWIVQMYLMGFDGISPLEKELRPAMESSSPVIGAIASYVKSAITNGTNLSFQNEIDFSKRVSKLLEEVGYDPNRVGNLGEKLAQIDRIATKDENGNLVEKEVFSFLQEFKDYRYVLAVERQKLQDKKDNWLNADYYTRDAFYQEYLSAKKEYEDFLNTFFNRDCVADIYSLDNKFFSDAVGQEAKSQREKILEQINDLADKDFLTGSNSEEEIKDLRKTFSLLGSIYDQNGEIKIGKDLEIAERIKNYNSESAQYYTYVPNDSYISKLFTEYMNLHPNDIDGFVSSHFHTELNEEVSLYRQERYAELASMKKMISAKPERPGYTRESNFDTLLDMVKPLRDEFRVPNPTGLTSEKLQEMKTLEEKEKDNYINFLGLTKAETERFEELNERYYGEVDNKSSDYAEYKTLLDLVTKYGSIQFHEREKTIRNELSGFTFSEPSEYFFAKLQELIDTICVDPDTANKLGDYSDAEKFYFYFLKFKKNPDGEYENKIDELPSYLDLNDQIKIVEFAEQNFVQRKDKNYPDILYCWKHSKPKNPEYEKQYKLYDIDGNLISVVRGIPNAEYCNRSVRDEFKTPKIIGKTIDVHGNWLPKSKEQLDKEIEYDHQGNVLNPIEDRYRFINEKYLKMDKDSPLYKLLEELKKIYLEWQENKPDSTKLGLDYPRIRKEGLEVYEKALIGSENKEGVTLLYRLRENAKRLLGKKVQDKIGGGAKDTIESGLNYVASNNLMAAGIISNPDGKNIPILGLTDLDIKEVSTDIIKTMFDYNKSLNIYSELKRIHPQISAIDQVLHTEKPIVNKDFDRLVEQFEYLVRREFQGIYNESGIMNSIAMNTFYNGVAKACAFMFFANNPESAIRSAFTQTFQIFIEAMSFRNMTPFDFAIGMAKGIKYTMERKTPLVGTDLSMGELPLDVQFAMVCDMNQGFAAQELGKRFTDTRFKQILAGKPFTMGRKFLESIAIFGAGFSILDHIKVPRYRIPSSSNSSLKKVRFSQAYEKGKDGLIRLKDGFDSRLNYVNTVIQFDYNDTFDSLAEKYCVPVNVIKTAFDNELPNIRFKKLEKIRQEHDKNLLISRSSEEVEALNKQFQQDIEEASPIIENTLFKYYINKNHEVMNRLGGAYAKFDTAKFQSKATGKWMSFLKKYFIPMASRRIETGRLLKLHTEDTISKNFFRSYAESFTQRRNFGLGGVEQSAYVGLAKGLSDFVFGRRRNKQTLNSLLFFASETLLLYIMQDIIINKLWKFYVPDDDDDKKKKHPLPVYDKEGRRYEADRSGIQTYIKQNTGPLPIPYLVSQQAYDQKNRPGIYKDNKVDTKTLLSNWLKYETFNIAVSILSESKSMTFAPETMLTSLGYGVYFGMPIPVQWTMDQLNSLQSEELYTRATSPYFWQQAGSPKKLKPIFGLMGLSGTFIDPYYGIGTKFKYQYDVYNQFFGHEMRNTRPKEEQDTSQVNDTTSFIDETMQKYGIDKTVTPYQTFNMLKQWQGKSYDTTALNIYPKPPKKKRGRKKDPFGSKNSFGSKKSKDPFKSKKSGNPFE